MTLLNRHMRLLFQSSLVLFLTLILTSCGSKDKKTEAQLQKAAQTKPQPLQVEALVAHVSNLSNVIEVPGAIMAYETTEIHPEVSGRVVQLNVHEGAFVGKGTLLAKLYDGDLQAQLNKINVQRQI